MFKPSAQLCRFAIVMLLFNMLAPLVFAKAGASGTSTALICTSSGYVTIQVSASIGASEAEQVSAIFDSTHCPYCQLFELPDGHTPNLAPYLAPSSYLALYYKSIISTGASEQIAQYTRLRAPPFFS